MPEEQVSTLALNIFDGTRQLFTPGKKGILVRIIDGNEKQLVERYFKKPSLTFRLPFYNDLRDKYTVIVYADDYKQAGFRPVQLGLSTTTSLDLMLIPTDPSFNFSTAPWAQIRNGFPFLGLDVDDATGKSRYEDLIENHPKVVACIFNLLTAMSQISLAHGTPVDYLKQICWNIPGKSPAQDRFFAYCDPRLIDEIRSAANRHLFAQEIGCSAFHPGATASWKQIQFGEANVQLTFHENDKTKIGEIDCIVVEPDIDYYKDPAAHALFEVLVNGLTGALTEPAEVYVLRWIAGRQAGTPEFNPPYSIVSD